MGKLISVLGVGLLLVSVNARAEDEAAKPEEKAAEPAAAAEAAPAPAKSSGGGKYGPAGCGLGSIIFSPDSGFTQIFAATTNGSSGNQTFGITSGTSNCDGGGGGSQSAKAFVQTNRAALAKDIARGRGETISALSTLAACQNSSVVGSRLQKKFRTIFSSAKATDEQVSDSVVEVLRSDASLGCSNLG
ncbi:MAG TPA: DUF3015 family protein [Polyangiaceae bacterium]|jgi:hypothetical protein|nr:DUF3015 family protein [Polyangiaceae bacterium]